MFLRALAFLVALFVVARYGAKWVGRALDTPDTELLVVLFLGFAVILAGTAEELGVADAIGAFMAGLILAETVVKRRVEELVLPIRDAFAALFFFWFGLTISPDGLYVLILAIVAPLLASWSVQIGRLVPQAWFTAGRG